MAFDRAVFTVFLLALPVLALATPLPELLERRSGVTCTKKYSGFLQAQSLSQGQVPLTVQFDHSYSIVPDTNKSSLGLPIQFDICTTDGWNVDGQRYGQLKPSDMQQNGPMCITGEYGQGDKDASLLVEACGDYNGGVLQHQWFHLPYEEEVDNFVLTGNPNSAHTARRNVTYQPELEPATILLGPRLKDADVSTDNDLRMVYEHDY